MPFEWFDKLWNLWYPMQKMFYEDGTFYRMGHDLSSLNFTIFLIWAGISFCAAAFVESGDDKLTIFLGFGLFGGALFSAAFPIILCLAIYSGALYIVYQVFSLLGKGYRSSKKEDKKINEIYERLQKESQL